ncbi:MAG TPA: HAD-IIA family hydrolase [Ruania sp.]|nr:HAD-IIA family hydrolase [Ruania sp.]
MSEHSTLLSSAQPLHAAYDAALVDLDGVAYRGPEPIEHAADSLARAHQAGMPAFYVTNNASRTPQMVSDQLNELGISTRPERIITAAQASAQLVLDTIGPRARVLPIGGTGLHVALQERQLMLVHSADERPDVVVQGFDKALTWADLAEATYAIKAGAQYIATNLDATIPTERGTTLGNGSLVAGVVHATGVTPRSAGKPQARIFEQASHRAGAQHPLVIGDRLDTDLAGARAAGFAGLHVLTGVDGTAELLRARPQERPSYLGADLRALGRPHPQVSVHTGGEVHCRQARARVSGQHVYLLREDGDLDLHDGGRLSMDELRAACVAAWQASDAADVATILPEPGTDTLTVSCD